MTHPAAGRWRGLLAIGLGAGIAPMDFAVNVAFPAITAAFALDIASMSWLVVSYVLTYASLMLAFGKLGDIVGHRRVICAGLVTGALAFVACGLATSYAWLLAGRVLQGISTALLLSCAPAMVVALCGETRRTWALSRYSMMIALAGIVGPVLGGVAMQWLGWAGVFWFRLPVTLLALWLLARMPAVDARPATQRFDVVSAMLLAGGLALLLLSPALWNGVHAVLPFAAGAAGLALLMVFTRRERRDAEPVLPPIVLRDSALLAANIGSVVVNLVGFAIPMIVPYYLARIGGFDAAEMGLLLAASTVGMFAGSMATPRVVQTFGQRRATLVGATLVALGQGAIALWTLTPLLPPVIALIAALLLHGVGIGLFQVSYTDLIVATLPPQNRGVAGSLAMLTRTIGVVIASVVLSGALQALEARNLAAGQAADAAFHAAFGTVFLYTALLLTVVLVLGCLRTMRSS